MKVKTYEVPTEVLEACESRILKGGFEAKEIEAVAVESGAPKFIERDFIANRIADRLIQKHRKLKNIHIPGKWGVWQLLQTTPTNLTVDNPGKNRDTPCVRTNDPLETQIAEALDAAGIEYLTDYEGKSPARLDFYLPDYDIYLEIKGGHSPRISKQMARHFNVIAIQGVKSVAFVVQMLLKK